MDIFGEMCFAEARLSEARKKVNESLVACVAFCER